MDLSLTNIAALTAPIAVGASAMAESARTMAANVPVMAGQAVTSGAAMSEAMAHDLGMAKSTVDAAAKGAPKLTGMQTAAKFLSRSVAVVVIGASTLQGASIVQAGGPGALLHTQDGRSAVLGAVGGSLLLVPFPPAQLGAAGLLALSAANEFGLFKRLDRAPATATVAAGTMPQARTLYDAAATPRAAHI